MELAAVGRDEFVQGFKLAGVRKTFSVDRDALEAQVAKVLDDANVGILILSVDDMKALSNTMRRRLETTPRPVVIAVGKKEEKAMGDFILRGLKSPGLTREKTWRFAPEVKQGQPVGPGDVVGTVQEAKNVEHRIMVPPNFRGGKVVQLKEGSFKVDEVVVQLDNGEQVKMHQTWPVRKARPVKERLMPTIPLVTGQRVLDFLFPIAKGGTAAIPGGFGTGKTVTEQQLSKWCDAQVVIYIGCGERGNEMTEVLSTFPKLIDPYTGAPLMERMSLIANTSNMPVAAREASVYTGMTLAEYYRDMGYNVDTQILEDWFRKNVNEEWPRLRSWTQRTLQEEAELEEIVRLVGADALPPDQQLTLEVARMIREIFLQQNAYHAVDTFCPPERQFKIISAIKKYSDLGQKAVKLDVPTKDVASLKSRELLTRVKYETEFDKELAKTLAQMDEEFKKLGAV